MKNGVKKTTVASLSFYLQTTTVGDVEVAGPDPSSAFTADMVAKVKSPWSLWLSIDANVATVTLWHLPSICR